MSTIKLPELPAPFEPEWPDLNPHALGCGVEDRGIVSRYEAAEYGFQDGVDKAAQCVPEDIYTGEQMRAYAEEAVHQALVPVRRDRELLEKLEAWQAVCDRIVDQYGGVVAGVDFAALGRANRVAITSSSSYDWEAVLPKPRTDLRYHGEFIRGWNQCLQEVLAVLSPHTPEPRDG